jgi:hypothetical protein
MNSLFILILLIFTSNCFAFGVTTDPENVAVFNVSAKSNDLCSSGMLSLTKKLESQNRIILESVECTVEVGSNRSVYLGKVKIYKY